MSGDRLASIVSGLVYALVPRGLFGRRRLIRRELVTRLQGAVVIERLPAAHESCVRARRARRALHPPPLTPIIGGSTSVFMSGFPAARWALRRDSTGERCVFTAI